MTLLGRRRVRGIFGVLLLSSTCVVPAVDATVGGSDALLAGYGYPLQLQSLYVSHGSLQPRFTPDVYEYSLALNHPYNELTVIPEVQEAQEYVETKRWPVVEVLWNGKSTIGAQMASAAVQNKIDVAGSGASFDASVVVMNPSNTKNKIVYKIRVSQNLPRSEQHLGIRTFLLTDGANKRIIVEDGKLPDTFTAYVDPQLSTINLEVNCVEGNSLSVNGAFLVNGSSVTVRREKWHHRQIVQILCYYQEGIVHGLHHSKYYSLHLYSDFPLDAIKPPKMIVDGAGTACKMDSKGERFICPTPDTRKGLTRMIAYAEPSIRYTVESRGLVERVEEELDPKDVEPLIQARLLEGYPSIPFDYAKGPLVVVGWSGRNTREWPLEFGGPGLGMWLGGWFLSLALSVLLPLLMVILTFSNALGIGAPFGAAEIASHSAFLLQFLCFASTFLRHRGFLQGIVQIVKWVTIFWPLPWEVDVDSLAYVGGVSNYGGIRRAVIGDCLSLENARGCIFWSAMILLGTSFTRACVAFKVGSVDRNRTFGASYTFPHKLLFGHWESRALHFLIFPVVTASTLIVTSPKAFTRDTFTSFGWELGALAAIGFFASWVLISYGIVLNAVKTNKVMWVWNAPLRETGEAEDEEGYWSDAVCDQLSTHSINRGILPTSILPWRWTTTAADIDPIVIYGRGDDQHNDRNSPLGGASANVVVRRTRTPGAMCPGQKMIAGLKRFDWVDVLFTYQALTRFHDQVTTDTRQSYSMPLIARVSQLSGPFSGGRFSFFFDGVRVPFIKIEDSIFRFVVGFCVGLCLAIQFRSAVLGMEPGPLLVSRPLTVDAHRLLAVCYGVISACSLGTLIYVMATRPFTRSVENVLLLMVLTVISMSSMAFMGYALLSEDPSYFADLCMAVTAIACGILAVYCTMVIVSLLSAMLCPPHHETRFLERLSNCTVSIADHAEGWAVDLPAFSKRQSKTVKAVCQHMLPSTNQYSTMQASKKPKLLVSLIPSDEEPSFEFTTVDMKRAVESNMLQCPLVCMYAPSTAFLGYKTENIYPRDDYPQVISNFLLSEPLTAPCGPELVRHIMVVVEKHKRARRKHMLSLTVIPPSSNTTVFEARKRATTPAEIGSSSGSSSSSSS